MPRWGDAEYSLRVISLLKCTQPVQAEIAEHEVYGLLGDIESVRVFMEHHVFAVWDFMSLLTAMRSHLTTVNVPWRPVGSAATRRFVNELMLAEESDVISGGYSSHFELYLDAMEAINADTRPIRDFVEMLQHDRDPGPALRRSGAPPAARQFVTRTWKTIDSGHVPVIVGSFAFGRESLIPAMFNELHLLAARTDELSLFCDYLDRHIELDEGVHAPLAYNIVSEVCGDDQSRWDDVRGAALEALFARRAMWDGIASVLHCRQAAPTSV
jgi:hypothetical protein